MIKIFNYLNDEVGENLSIYEEDIEDDLYLQKTKYNLENNKIIIEGYNESIDDNSTYIIKESEIVEVQKNSINLHLTFINDKEIILEKW